MIDIVGELKTGLGISSGVAVRIVDDNRLALSVEPVDRERRNFLILADAQFLAQLDPDEITAAHGA
jgi:hypothetical protein